MMMVKLVISLFFFTFSLLLCLVSSWPETKNKPLTMEDISTTVDRFSDTRSSSSNVDDEESLSLSAKVGSSCTSVAGQPIGETTNTAVHLCHGGGGSELCYFSALPPCCDDDGGLKLGGSGMVQVGHDKILANFFATGGFESGKALGVCLSIPRDDIIRCDSALLSSPQHQPPTCSPTDNVCVGNSVSCDASSGKCRCLKGYLPPGCCECDDVEGKTGSLFTRYNGQCVDYCRDNCERLNGQNSCSRCRPGYVKPGCCSCTDDRVLVENRCLCRVGMETPRGGCVECRSDQKLLGEVCACPSGQSEVDGMCAIELEEDDLEEDDANMRTIEELTAAMADQTYVKTQDEKDVKIIEELIDAHSNGVQVNQQSKEDADMKTIEEISAIMNDGEKSSDLDTVVQAVVEILRKKHLASHSS